MHSYLILATLIILGLIIFLFLQPAFILLCNLSASFYFFIYKSIHRRQYETLDLRAFWDKPVRLYARFLKIIGRIYHGYEIIGSENIPTNGPALLILYHGIVPMDACFFLPTVLLDMNRKVVTIVDRLTQSIPGYKTFLEAAEQTPGSIEFCIETINRGDLLAIYPGGTREGFLADQYDIVWRDNAGFAKIALATNAPIIPIFTQNVRECFWVLSLFRSYFRKIYLKRKTGFALFLGWYPIKLRSFVSEPVMYDLNDSVEEVVRKTKMQMENLINTHQRIPNSVFSSLIDRFRSSKT